MNRQVQIAYVPAPCPTAEHFVFVTDLAEKRGETQQQVERDHPVWRNPIPPTHALTRDRYLSLDAS